MYYDVERDLLHLSGLKSFPITVFADRNPIAYSIFADGKPFFFDHIASLLFVFILTVNHKEKNILFKKHSVPNLQTLLFEI